jgi:hypothetical protein
MFVLLCIHIAASGGDFVRQVGNLRPIVNRPAGITHNAARTVPLFAACRYVGQVG